MTQLISLSSLMILMVYIVSLIASHRRPRYAACGLVSFVMMLAGVACLKVYESSMIEMFGYDGYAFRWHATMSFIVFMWFVMIQRTNRMSILAPVCALFSLDVLSMLLSGFNTAAIDPFISAAMIVCHIAYCAGCIHGGVTCDTDHHSFNQDAKEIGRGGAK